jgi:hypothetical protein
MIKCTAKLENAVFLSILNKVYISHVYHACHMPHQSRPRCLMVDPIY